MNKEELLKKNKEFIKHADKALLNELVKGQHPSVCVLCCSDSRVIPEEIFSSTFGDIFTIRSAGNVVNAGELASLEYAIEHLHIKLVVVLGHTHCGAVHASIHNEKGEYLDPILDKIKENILDEHDEIKASKINAIKVKEYIESKFPNKEIEVAAMLYDIGDGLVSIL